MRCRGSSPKLLQAHVATSWAHMHLSTAATLAVFFVGALIFCLRRSGRFRAKLVKSKELEAEMAAAITSKAVDTPPRTLIVSDEGGGIVHHL